MKNKLLSPTNAMATITILAGLLGVTKESIAQNLASNQKNKAQTENNQAANNINIRNTEDPIRYAFNNIEKYYPIKNDPKVSQYLENFKKELNWPRAKIKIAEANKILKSIGLPKTRSDKDITTFIAWISELEVMSEWTLFSDTYREEGQIPEETKYYDNFKKTYTDRFDAYEKQFNENLAQLQQKIKDLEQSIKDKEQIYQQQIKDIMKLLDSFSVEDIESNNMVFEAVKKTKSEYIKQWRKITPHAEQLFWAIK